MHMIVEVKVVVEVVVVVVGVDGQGRRNVLLMVFSCFSTAS